MKKILFIFFLLIILYIVLNIQVLKNLYIDFGDLALISLKVEFAKQFKELLGPYSRMGFFHPGPITFYFYAFLGSIIKSLLFFFDFSSISVYYFFSQFVINLITLIFIFFAFPRIIDKNLRLIFIIIFLILWENLNPSTSYSMIFDIWGPVIIILPFLLLLISLISLMIESHRFELIFFIVFSLSIIISNHLSGVLYAGFFSFIVLMIWIFKKEKIWYKKNIFWLILSFVFFFISIAPPLYEFFLNFPDNNISKMIQTSIKTSALRKGKDVLVYFGELWAISFIKKPVSLIGWIIFIIINIFIYKIYKKNKLNKIVKYTYYMVNVQTILLLFYIAKIPFDLLHYLSWFYLSVIMLYILLILYAIYKNININYKKRNIFINSTFVILIFILLVQLYIKSRFNDTGFIKEYYVLNEIKKHFNFKSDDIYKIEWGFGDEHHNNWVLVSGIVLDFYKSHIATCIGEEWLFMFGSYFDCKRASQNNTKILNIKKTSFFVLNPVVKKEYIDNQQVYTLYYYHYKIYLIDNDKKN